MERLLVRFAHHHPVNALALLGGAGPSNLEELAKQRVQNALAFVAPATLLAEAVH